MVKSDDSLPAKRVGDSLVGGLCVSGVHGVVGD